MHPVVARGGSMGHSWNRRGNFRHDLFIYSTSSPRLPSLSLKAPVMVADVFPGTLS